MKSFRETIRQNKASKSMTLIMVLCMMLMLSGCCLKHDYEEAACEQPKTCTKCGKTEGEPLGHSYAAATCELPQICMTCGAKSGYANGHLFEEATCTKAKTCKVCGKTVGSALEHNYAEATCTEPAVCTRCGETSGSALGHDFKETSCTKESVCSRCKETKPAAGHSFKQATCTEPKECTKCGEKDGQPLGHKIVNGKCERCGLSLGDKNYIATFIGRKSTVEEDYTKCLVNVDTSENPYDVIYNYGDDYNELTGYCDWSLVFDAAYYKKTFPMLALQYHNDDELLLLHFKTVGIHEGRQGSAKFNVGAYLNNCDYEIYKTFHREDSVNYECYYLYYMLNYDKEKDVDTVKAKNGKTVRQQYRLVLTQLQSSELAKTNVYRAEVESEAIKADGELNAIANYRAYINQVEGWTAHDWMVENKSIGQEWMKVQNSASYAENMIESRNRVARICAEGYYGSPSHYEAMVAAKYKYVGLGNTFTGTKKNSKGYNTYTFDVYMTAVDGSPYYKK